MENNQTDPNKTGTMTTQKTNEDFNKKQPDPKDPNEKKAELDPEVPNLDVPKKGEPDDIKMGKKDKTEDVKDNTLDVKAENSDAEAQRKESIPKVSL